MAGKNLMHLLRFIVKQDEPYTQTTASERNLISKYARGKSKAVEIGVYEGVNTITIAAAIAEGGTLYGIDPFFKGKLGICWGKWVAVLSMKRAKVRDKVILVEKLSFDAINDVPSEIDFIFIDGDHSYEGIKKDWELFSDIVKPNGYILLHDTLVPEFDLSRASLGSIQFYKDVVTSDERFELVDSVDSLTVLKRKHT
ncbi:MAG: class I SAM-dependent methyltransferase [Chitinophagales bacterium]|nr:class I SAM-dependent methyltransferase [Chitinophagaceae bacterium]MCB9064655.1 class I SAM-dependent methyltransferase [Chitinophagales bacterium]